jgi:hypothetical protein
MFVRVAAFVFSARHLGLVPVHDDDIHGFVTRELLLSASSLILLAGMGDTAYVFDQIRSKLSMKCHVYGVT